MCKNRYPENTRLRHITLYARKKFVVGYYSFFLFIKYIRLIIKHFLQYNISKFCYFHFLLLHNIVLTFCLTLMFVLIILWFNGITARLLVWIQRISGIIWKSLIWKKHLAVTFITNEVRATEKLTVFARLCNHTVNNI